MYLSETKSHLTTAHEITWKLIHLLVGWILYLYCFPVFFFLGCLLVFHVLLCPLVFVFHFCAFGFSFSFFFFQISALPFNTFFNFFLINSCLLQKISLWLSEEEQQIHVREKICLYCRHPGIRLLCLMTLSGLLIATKIYITLLSPDLRTPFLFQPRLTLVEEMSWARTYKQTANSNRWSRTILFCGCWQMIQLLYIM